jgi:hypothetical protein
MLSNTKTLNDRLLKRRCVACGYDGALLRNGFATRCAKCGCDLRKRPARSYVEMEGLPGARRGFVPMGFDPEPHVLSRWLAFLFLAMLMLIVIIALSTATLAV